MILANVILKYDMKLTEGSTKRYSNIEVEIAHMIRLSEETIDVGGCADHSCSRSPIPQRGLFVENCERTTKKSLGTR